MKKILFISTRNPFSGRYSGDVIRAEKFVYFLSRKNYVKVISLDDTSYKKKDSKLSYEGFSKPNIFLKIFNIFSSFLQLNPLQLGFFYSSKIKKFVDNNHENFDLIIFQSFRTAQYLPQNAKEKSILDMADLVSRNYYQSYKRLFFLNPLKIIYMLESILLKKYEKNCLINFKKILLHSNEEIKSLEKSFQSKVVQYSFGVEKVSNKYKFNKKNNKIIFIGNIKYLPNRDACYEFVNSILPSIIKIYPDIEFHIIGEISKFDKFIFERENKVKVHNKVRNLEPYLNNVICGLANLNISSGIQTKLLTYMSYGIPSICSQKVAKNFDAIKGSKINIYKDNKEMIKLILKLKKNKDFSVKSSKSSLKKIKDFKWEKILLFLDKIV